MVAMHLSQRAVRLAITIFALILFASACGSDDESVIHIYTGRHYDLELAFDQFSEQTGIKIEYLEGSDAELRERIAAEGGDTEADIYMTVDAGNLAIAAQHGVFASIDSATLSSAVPQSLRDPSGQWFGLSMRARTIMYHPDRVAADEVPATYEELAEPRWAGRLCMRNSSNVYTQSLTASLISNLGRDQALAAATGWADNAEILASDTLILESVAEGLCDVAVTNHYYLARLLQENPEFPVRLAWANQDGRGAHVNISGAGVTRHADNPEGAQQLLEWLATDGQSLFVDGNHEYPVNPTVSPEDLIATSFGATFVRDDLNAADFGSLNSEAVRLLDEAGYE